MVSIYSTEIAPPVESPQYPIAEPIHPKEILTYEQLDNKTETALDRLEDLVGPKVLSGIIAGPQEGKAISSRGVDLIVDGKGRYAMLPGSKAILFLGETEDEIRRNASKILREQNKDDKDKSLGQELLEAAEAYQLVPQKLHVTVEGEVRRKSDLNDYEQPGFGVDEITGIQKKTLSQMAGLVKTAVSKGLQYSDISDSSEALVPWTKMTIPFGDTSNTLIVLAGGTEEADKWSKKTSSKKYGGKAIILLKSGNAEPERIDIGNKEFIKSVLGPQIIESLYHTFYGDNPDKQTLKEEAPDLTSQLGSEEQVDEMFLRYNISGTPGEVDSDTFARQLNAMVELTGPNGSLAEMMVDWKYGKPSIVEALNTVVRGTEEGKTERTLVKQGVYEHRDVMVETLLWDTEQGTGGRWERVSPKFLPLVISPNLVILEDVEPGRASQGSVVVIKKYYGGWHSREYNPRSQLDEIAAFVGRHEKG